MANGQRIIGYTTGSFTPLSLYDATNFELYDGTNIIKAIPSMLGSNKMAAAFASADRAITGAGLAPATNAIAGIALGSPGADIGFGYQSGEHRFADQRLHPPALLPAAPHEQRRTAERDCAMIDLLFRATTRKDFEAMARTAQFIDDENLPLPGINVDPLIGTPEYETGIPIIIVEEPPARGKRGGKSGRDIEVTPPTLKTGWHCNVRVSGEREAQEIAGLPQTDAEGNLLPASQRTHFGIAFSDNGTVVADGATEGISYLNVALINELTILSPQRVWQ